jgi:hypothetical protein
MLRFQDEDALVVEDVELEQENMGQVVSALRRKSSVAGKSTRHTRKSAVQITEPEAGEVSLHRSTNFASVAFVDEPEEAEEDEAPTTQPPKKELEIPEGEESMYLGAVSAELEPLERISDVGNVNELIPRFKLTEVFTRNTPCIILLSIVVPLLLLIVAVTGSGQFQLGSVAFAGLQHPAVQATVSFEATLLNWASIQQTAPSTLDPRTFPKYRLFVQFVTKDNSDMLEESPMKAVQAVESYIFETTNYLALCWTNKLKLGKPQLSFPQCVPPSSLTTYFFPGQLQKAQSGFVEFELSGLGSDYQRNFARVRNTIAQNDRYRWFGDFGFNNQTLSTAAVRTQITLGYPVLRNGTEVSSAEYNQIVDAFVLDLVERVGTISAGNVDVTIGGDRIIEAFVRSVLSDQMMLTLIAVAAAFVAMLLQIRNFVLAIASLCQLALSFLSAYGIYVSTSSSGQMTLITAVAIIITLSLNSHSIAAIHEGFAQSGRIPGTGRRSSLMLEQRVAMLFKSSISAAVVAHLVEVLAFAMCILSPVPALRDFGVVTSVATATNMWLCMTFWPAVIVFYSWFFDPSAQTLLRQKKLNDVHLIRRNIFLRRFLRGEEATKHLYEESTTQQMQDVVNGDEALATSASAFNRDPLQRRESMSILLQQPDGPTKATFVSKKLVPLACVFQISQDVVQPAVGRPVVDNAIASYARRLTGEMSGTTLLKPAVLKNGLLQSELPSAEITKHRLKWEYMARFLGTVRQDDFSAYVTEQLAMSIRAESVAWDDKRNVKSETELRSAPLPNYSYPVETKPIWKYPTREMRDAPKVNRIVTHVGMNTLERLIVSRGRLLEMAGRPIVLLALILTVVLLVLALQIQPLDGEESIVDGASSAVKGFNAAKKRFPIKGPCDYCSAYQQPPTKLPQVSLIDMQTCKRQGFGLQMYAVTDFCGKCFGTEECLDCAARPWGASSVDSCGVCVTNVTSDPTRNRCAFCEKTDNSINSSCFPCGKLGYTGTGGATCSVTCNIANCPPEQGKCNFWTGACECFQDFENGFFSDDGPRKCASCTPGFSSPSSGKRCTLECSDGDACGCLNSRCTGCPAYFMGSSCATPNTSACVLGTITPSGCSCPADLDSSRCLTHSSCSYHGRLYTPSEANVLVPTCGCVGQWTGSRCQFCKCYNGGTCDPVTGKCVCLPGWGNIDCSTCSLNCTRFGICPSPWEPENYAEISCIAVWCNASSIASGIPCRECNRKNQAACDGAPASPLGCEAVSGCTWNVTTSTCDAFYRSIPATTKQSQCTFCVRDITGPDCGTCKGEPYGLSCAVVGGTVIGCDGMETPIGQNYKTVDRCGVCRGTGSCLGCDGILGSTYVLDACGVCRGKDECKRGLKPKIEVALLWGIAKPSDFNNGSYGAAIPDPAFDLSNVDFQLFLRQTCWSLENRSDLLSAADSECVWIDFIDWVLQPSTQAIYNTSVSFNMSSFPFEASIEQLSLLLFQFAHENNRFSELGFSSFSNASRVIWLRLIIASNLPVGAGQSDLLDQYYAFEEVRKNILLDPRNRGFVLASCAQWATVIEQLSSTVILQLGIGLGLYAFTMGAFVATLQPLLVIFGLWGMVFTISTTFATFTFLSWPLGPVELIGGSLTVAVSSHFSTHLIFSYSENLSSDVSSVICPTFMRISAMRLALMCSIKPILTCLMTSIVGALTVSFSIVTVFSRIGTILIVSQLASALFSIVILPAAITVIGPTLSNRFQSGRLLVFWTLYLCTAVLVGSLVLSGRIPEVSQGYLIL